MRSTGSDYRHKARDSRTLVGVLSQIERLTDVKPDEVNVDLGYRGHGVKDENIEVILAHQKLGITPAKKKRQKRRSAS
ncbi:MAG: hypothetical protein KAI61_04715 [Alphaproteobacteria bacterium]|nr:hypothetical protein [Alphaproteobacteria bacterium]